jgi:hypothetical protein
MVRAYHQFNNQAIPTTRVVVAADGYDVVGVGVGVV